MWKNGDFLLIDLRYFVDPPNVVDKLSMFHLFMQDRKRSSLSPRASRYPHPPTPVVCTGLIQMVDPRPTRSEFTVRWTLMEGAGPQFGVMNLLTMKILSQILTQSVQRLDGQKFTRTLMCPSQLLLLCMNSISTPLTFRFGRNLDRKSSSKIVLTTCLFAHPTEEALSIGNQEASLVKSPTKSPVHIVQMDLRQRTLA